MTVQGLSDEQVEAHLEAYEGVMAGLNQVCADLLATAEKEESDPRMVSVLNGVGRRLDRLLLEARRRENTTAADARTAASRRLRQVIEECERVLATSTDEVDRAKAMEWLDRLLHADGLSGYPSFSSAAASPSVAGGQRHSRGGGLRDQSDGDYEGWGPR